MCDLCFLVFRNIQGCFFSWALLPTQLCFTFPIKANSQGESFLKVGNMTDSINWRSFWLDHTEKFSDTRLTIDEKIQNMDRLQLKRNAWGLTDRPQSPIIKAHQHIEVCKFNFVKPKTCYKVCVFKCELIQISDYNE